MRSIRTSRIAAALVGCLVAAALQHASVAAAFAADAAGVGATPIVEPDAESCRIAVESARELAESLPEDNLSRRMAESYLVQARVEAGNGEFDDCVEMAGRATVEVRERRHR